MGNCCNLLKKSRYRSDEKASVDQVGYKRTSLSSHANTNPIAFQSDLSLNKKKSYLNAGNNGSAHPVHQKHSVQTNQAYEHKLDETNLSIPHIADFYPEEENSTLPADNPRTSTLFLPKANSEKRKKMNESTYFNQKGTSETILNVSKKYNSCSTIYIDDSTVSQPNLKAEIRLVACAIHYHIKRRTSNRTMDIFDEKLYPLSKDSSVSKEYEITVPDQRVIYKFMKNLFTAAQLTAECAIVTLIYLERVLTYAEIDLCPSNWRRLLLGAILLASKVWDDQAVWNVDYCQILKDVNVENMNELERQYLNLLQFNINVPSSVYAKYYFDLRTLADDNNLLFPLEKLTKEKAFKLEALSSVCQEKYKDSVEVQIRNLRRTASAGNLHSPSRKSLVILS